jgi:hypothetical protein
VLTNTFTQKHQRGINHKVRKGPFASSLKISFTNSLRRNVTHKGRYEIPSGSLCVPCLRRNFLELIHCAGENTLCVLCDYCGDSSDEMHSDLSQITKRDSMETPFPKAKSTRITNYVSRLLSNNTHMTNLRHILISTFSSCIVLPNVNIVRRVLTFYFTIPTWKKTTILMNNYTPTIEYC